MTFEEFGVVMAYLGSAAGRKAPREQVEVYYDLLGDLPADAFLVAAKQAVLESAYPTIPPVGVLRDLATAAIQGMEMSPSSAWELATRAVRRYGWGAEGKGLASLPPLVRRAVQRIGWQDFCASEMPDTLRAHFLRAFESAARDEKRDRVLPAQVKETIARIGQGVPREPPSQLPQGVIAKIYQERDVR